jgi:hypothetical protein
MNSSKATGRNANKDYWMNHQEQQSHTGLSKYAYCKKHGLSYQQFLYWRKKSNNLDEAKIIPVTLKSEFLKPASLSNIVCTLELKSGHSLKIYDESLLFKLIAHLQ